MTVKELKEELEGLPEEATIILKHELVGNEQYAERVEYEKSYLNPDHGIVVIRETM